MNLTQKTNIVKKLAQQAGFEFCGIAKAVKLDEDARRLEKWLNQKHHAKMSYMENHFDVRIDPALLVPEAKSVITVLKNYLPSLKQNTGAPKISKYAYGKDYHDIIRKDLRFLYKQMTVALGEFNGRGFVDSAPVLERTWAKKSGLGWIGKNGMLINKTAGSYFFIATLIVDIALEYDDPFAKDYCGSCTRCIDHCPTEAILPNKILDAGRCISYFTIEMKDEIIPVEMKNKFNEWIFGCDICNDVCPWNKFSSPTSDDKFAPINEIINFNKEDWYNLTENAFNKIFKYSPLKRSKYKGIMRNLNFVKINEETS